MLFLYLSHDFLLLKYDEKAKKQSIKQKYFNYKKNFMNSVICMKLKKKVTKNL